MMADCHYTKPVALDNIEEVWFYLTEVLEPIFSWTSTKL